MSLSRAVLLALAIALIASPCRSEDEPRFFPIEIYLDAGTQHFAAYQLEIRLDGAEIVGVEGGEHPAFAGAPYYDPAALGTGRIKLAALSTAHDLPTGRSRVATLHVREIGKGQAKWQTTSVLATDSAARPIDARLELVAGGEGQDR